MTGSDEAFYLDSDGQKRDAAIHDDMLDNPEAHRAIQQQAMESAIAEGMDPAVAMRLYGNSLSKSDE